MAARVHDAARIAFAGLGLAAIGWQLARLEERGHVLVGNYASYFTTQSNLAAAVLLVATALVPRSRRSRRFEAIRGGVTLAIAITGVVFTLFLSDLEAEVGGHNPFSTVVLHAVVPVVVVVDWLVDPPRQRLGRPVALAWLAYPLAWFVYTLVRGSVVHWYPYAFVDVARHGYAAVLQRAGWFLVAFALGALALAEAGNRRATRAPRSPLPRRGR